MPGYADISTTQIYLNYADEEVEETARAFASGQAGEDEESGPESRSLREQMLELAEDGEMFTDPKDVE